MPVHSHSFRCRASSSKPKRCRSVPILTSVHLTGRLYTQQRAGPRLARARQVGHELGVGRLDDLQLGLLAAARLGQLVAIVAQALVHAALACVSEPRPLRRVPAGVTQADAVRPMKRCGWSTACRLWVTGVSAEVCKTCERSRLPDPVTEGKRTAGAGAAPPPAGTLGQWSSTSVRHASARMTSLRKSRTCRQPSVPLALARQPHKQAMT